MEMKAYAVGGHQGIDGLLSQLHPIRFATEVREFYPHYRVILWIEHECPNLQHSLPHLYVWLASL